MCPPGRLCWGSDWLPALFWGNNEQRGGDAAVPAWEAHTFPFPAPFPSSLHIKSEVHSDCSLPFWPHTKRGGEGLQRLAAK